MTVGLVRAGGKILAETVAGIAPFAVIKQADEAITSTTLQPDNELTLNLPTPGAQYLFECFIDYEGGTQGASDFQWDWAVPVGASLKYAGFWVGTGGGNVTGNSVHIASDVVTAGTGGSGNPRAIMLHGSLIVGV